MDCNDTICSNNTNIPNKHCIISDTAYLLWFDVLGGVELLKILQVTVAYM